MMLRDELGGDAERKIGALSVLSISVTVVARVSHQSD
jgi:hypothetical protein